MSNSKIIVFLCLMCLCEFTYSAECKVKFNTKFNARSIDYVIVQNLTKGTKIKINVSANDSLRLTDQNETAVVDVRDEIEDIRVLYYPDGRNELNFNAKHNGNVQVNLVGIDGKLIKSTNQYLNEGTNSFLLTLPLGVYVVQVIGSDYTYFKKVVNSKNLQFPAITFIGRNAFTINSTRHKINTITESSKIVYLYCDNSDNLLFNGVSGIYSTTVNTNLFNFWNNGVYANDMTISFDFVESCVDADGNIYSVIPLGPQLWMAENLRTTKYRNSTPISNITNLLDWANDRYGAFNHYANDINNDNGAKYGHFYNWYAVNNINNLAPDGWHIPTDSEWKRMNDYMMKGYGYNAGKNLKSTIDWTSGESTNLFAFNGYPIGSLSGTSGYIQQNKQVDYWSSTPVDASYALNWFLNSSTDSLKQGKDLKDMGCIIRCIKDSSLATVHTFTPNQKFASVTVGGMLDDFGGTPIKECGICYSNSTTNPTIDDTKIVLGVNIYGNTNSNGIPDARCYFSSQILGINLFSKYYIRAYAINSSGLAYGEVLTFQNQPISQDSIFAKIYSTLGLTGNQQPFGDPDISTVDEATTSFVRLIWNLNELTTDEAMCSWGDPGISELNFCKLSSNHDQLNGMYKRLYFNINLCSFFINQIETKNDVQTIKQRAEARFLRALNYYYLLDMFGNVPVPELGILQATRSQIFNYLQDELAACESEMFTPRASDKPYYRVDQAANWLLRSRLYLNAEVYTGTARWDLAAIYSMKVINSGYTLCPVFRQLFMADNAGVFDGSTVNQAPTEIILPIYADGIKASSWFSSLFLIASTHTTGMVNWGSNAGWGGNRARSTLVKKFFPTGTTFFSNTADLTTAILASMKDGRALFDKKSVSVGLDISSLNTFKEGYQVIKYSNIRADGGRTSDSQYTDMDVPLMRAAEAYLNYAEAVTRGAAVISGYAALDAVNALRTRAGAPVFSTLTLQNIIDERAREFFFEGHRRTDLIRFGQFGGNTNYLWDWKGGASTGTNFAPYLNVFPIPQAEIDANTNLSQNPGY